MTIKATFLEEIKPGDWVELMIGLKEIKGTVIALDSDTVRLREKGGKKPVLALDSITYYVVDEGHDDNAEGIVEKNVSRENEAEIESTRVAKSEIQAGEVSEPNPNVFTALDLRGDKYFGKTSSPAVKNYWDIAKNEKSKISGELFSIANSLDYAIKKNHETSPADYKIQDNISKLKRIAGADKKNKAAANMLSALYYQCKSDRLSLETYKDGDDNESAFAVAESINSIEYMELFACRHFIEDEELNAHILKWLVLRVIETQDYSIISKIDMFQCTPTRLVGYKAFMKAILLANSIEYDSMLDYRSTNESLSELIHIFLESNIGFGTKMAEYIPEKEQPDETIIKPIFECPTYMAAKTAREQEKNFAKAEKLYIESIKRNERPGAAAADLVGLMMQKHNFSKAAEYLGQYGYKYMRENAYKNVRAQLVSKDPKLAHKISQAEKVEVEQDYFILAQKAELEEKDLQKAITYYKEAIKKRQRLTGSIPNLVSIYIRLEMYDEALTLLDDTGKRYMDKGKYLNMRLSIFGASKSSKYKSEIIETYKQVISISNSREKRTDLLFSEAFLLNQIGEYEIAIGLIQQCLNEVENKAYLVPEKAKRQRLYAFIGLSNAYTRMGKYEKAVEYAKKVLDLQPDNELAKSIISGRASEELEDNTVGVSKISEFFIKKIDSIDLENELKRKGSIKKGRFTGTPDEGVRIIDAIKIQQIPTSINDEIKSNNYFSIAKLIRQILDRDIEVKLPKNISEQQYQMNVAIGCFLFGNYRLNKTDIVKNYDTARYCFFEAISIFQDSDVTHQCWAAATARYIQTFFLSESDIRKKRSGLYYNFEDYGRDYQKEYIADIDSSMERGIQTSIEEFVVGMIEMLSYNPKIRKEILHNTINHPMSGRILDVMGKICDEQISDSVTEDEELFSKIWEKTSRKYYAKRKAFLQIIEDTIESVFIIGQLSENYSRFIGNEFCSYLCKMDKEYIEELQLIFAELLRYNEESEFDYKADRLRRADDRRKRLEEKIGDNPTYVGFEKLLLLLTQLQAKIFKESAQLYGDSKPQLSVVLSGDCSFENDKMIVRVPVAYTNKANAQNADNVQMSVSGEGVENTDNTMLSRDLWIGDGRVKEKMLTFKISEKVLEDQVFSIRISIIYQYKKNMTETEDGAEEFELTVPLYSESVFEPIENKFKIISGGDPVHDKSMFYGRDKDIDSIINQIYDASPDSKSGKCLVLYGQTRTGKSSILHHLKVRLREKGDENIIIDMESLGKLGLYGSNITDFLYKLLRSLNKEIMKHHPDLVAVINEQGIKIDYRSLMENSEQSQMLFNEIFDEVYEVIMEQDEKYHIVLMIDEFTYIYDWIRQGTMTDRIMKFWKAFMQTHNVFAIIIGQDHMMQFMTDQRFTNDFGIMELMKVSYLSKEDAQRLMDEPILYENAYGEKISRYKEGALDRIYELTSGSAFLIGKICAGLVEYLNDTHSVFITRAHIDDYIKNMLPSFDVINFEPLYRDMSEIGDNTDIIERNIEMLKRIALFSNKKEYTPVDAIVQSQEDRKILEKLEQRDVVIISNGDRCKIKVVLYKEYLIAKSGLGVL